VHKGATLVTVDTSGPVQENDVLATFTRNNGEVHVAHAH
jgi:hypothetical protein